MTTMRERIARAVCDHDNLGTWDELSEGLQRYFMNLADAVLAAIEEPDEAMFESLHDLDYTVPRDEALDIWRAMVRVARETKEQT